jgi:muramoyltetrapeptide carboxypeptidase
MIRPPLLSKNHAIGVVAPSSPFDEHRFAHGLRILEEMGFRPILAPNLRNRQGHLAGTDQERAADFTEMFLRPEVGAVMAARGGFGTLRLLENLDFSIFARTPKPLVGFSDLTVLLNVIAQRSSLITFHGPVVTSLPRISGRSRQSLYDMLTSPEFPPITWEKTEVVRPGPAEGRLFGGNLTTLCHLLGTPYEPSFEKTILILEDVNEPLYRIDRMLTHLKLAGKLDQVEAVLLGDFQGCESKQAVWERVCDLLPRPSIPLWGNMPLGHGEENYTWPIGAYAKLVREGEIHFHHES